MRKLFVLALGCSMLLGIAAPAHAGKPTRTTYSSASANAFWYSFEQVSRTTTRSTVWYVGVYASTDGTFSDLYREITTCRRDRCSSVFAIGFSDLSNDVFTIDSSGLMGAHIDATYVLESFDDSRRSTGTTETVHIVADWEGVGTVEQNGGSYSYRDDFISIRATFEDAFRAAEATGSVNDADLGETYDAYLAASTSTSVERVR